MAEIIEAIVVGVVQGLTEFIPVSSSAHLNLAPWILGFDQSRVVGTLAFDVFLHLGSVVALLLYFRHDWVRLIRAWFASVRDRSIGTDPDRRLIWLLIAATIPAGLIGLAFEGAIEQTFHADSNVARLTMAGFLTVGGAGLWLADRFGGRHRTIASMTLPLALTIGLSQALALMPGISRSGATITAGLAVGLNRESAARFAFLMATPITLGAGIWGSRRLFADPLTGLEWASVGGAFLASLVASVIAIGFLLAWLRRRSVAVFSIYRFALAALVAVLVITGH